MKILAEELIRIAKSIIANDVQDAIDAYGDLHNSKDRNLNWKGKFLPANKVIEIISKSLPDGYNDFDPQKVNRLIKNNSNFKFSFGRDYSPVLYIKGITTKKEVDKLIRNAKKVLVDEISLEKPMNIYLGPQKKDKEYSQLPDEFKNGIIRLWWD